MVFMYICQRKKDNDIAFDECVSRYIINVVQVS